MKRRFRSIEELIDSLEMQMEDLSERIKALKKSPSSFNEELIFKYIETQSTIKAAEFAKNQGVRSSKGTVFSSGDVSTIIKEGGPDVNPVLIRIAREIFKKNTKAVNRMFN